MGWQRRDLHVTTQNKLKPALLWVSIWSEREFQKHTLSFLRIPFIRINKALNDPKSSTNVRLKVRLKSSFAQKTFEGECTVWLPLVSQITSQPNWIPE